MNDIIKKFYAQRSEREIALHYLRERINQDEYNLEQLNNTIKEIRNDIKELKQMIAYLRKNFTS